MKNFEIFTIAYSRIIQAKTIEDAIAEFLEDTSILEGLEIIAVMDVEYKNDFEYLSERKD